MDFSSSNIEPDGILCSSQPESSKEPSCTEAAVNFGEELPIDHIASKSSVNSYCKNGDEMDTSDIPDPTFTCDLGKTDCHDFVTGSSTSSSSTLPDEMKVEDESMDEIVTRDQEGAQIKTNDEKQGEGTELYPKVTSEVSNASKNKENVVKAETDSTDNPPENCIVDSVGFEESVTFEELCEESMLEDKSSKVVPKLDMSSEDEEVNFYVNSGKSGAESSSSKDESPSGPSCSGTSRAGLNSLSSDSEDDLPNVNLTLPLKKRKREIYVDVVSSSSCSEDESKSEIDYSNLTPEEIKSLIEEAKRYGTIKRKCKCPKKKWSELPIKGPTEPSGKCTIGKGDWSERSALPCAACSAGDCHDTNHKRRSRRKVAQPRMSLLAKTRARGTIGQDVPVIELSDTEEMSTEPTTVASEITITAIPHVPAGECIVLSSSDDDDDIVCEGVIKTEAKNTTMLESLNSGILPKERSPDVVVLSTSEILCQPPTVPNILNQAHAHHPMPGITQAPSFPPHLGSQAADTEPWPDFGIDLESWDDTINLLANIVGPPNGDGAPVNAPRANASAAVPDRPSTPEGWSCPICLESKTAVNEIMSTTCGHVFCGNCIRSAVKIHKKCPTCRKKLTLKQFHKIFL